MFNKLTPLGKAAVVVVAAGVVSVAGVGAGTVVKEHAELKSLKANPVVVNVVVTATPTATPSATLVPTKALLKVVPVATKAAVSK
jgi:hypothetical protein